MVIRLEDIGFKFFPLPRWVNFYTTSLTTMSNVTPRGHFVPDDGNQLHGNYATIPPHSSANLAQSVLISAQPIVYEAWCSPMSQINSSMQQSILNDMHQLELDMKRMQLLKCLPSMELGTRFTQNPVTSDYMFPGTHHIQK
ncbi:hypothetical protein CEXT_49611 [Caerostris extrusa]|uniref:Uncharacterized protein n=1 Tax=Caerostris extrusa TaxID=172846 RepID=A0AAV4VCJ4_CAEEX|nr:hypothetical protein CEXT_49611 [Caerostris extrusa]